MRPLSAHDVAPQNDCTQAIAMPNACQSGGMGRPHYPRDPALVSDSPARQFPDAELALDGLDAVLGLHIGTAHSLFVGRLERQLDPLGVTPKQVAILWLVKANPGIRQTGLSRFFRIERPTVHQFVRQLRENGFLINEPCKHDRRAGGLWITPEGQAILAQARAVIGAYEAERVAGLSGEERAELFRLLAKLCATASLRDA
ncbi:hypothetical protein NUTIK01_09470 [Novosphingobium sp. IK01]|uniref:HTH marR-type domain-containing protein n=1 Tax=Novosphingobium pituita TaxID=3056842 RepID=A0ABQ6P5L8_9SPHN|nr:hypothetical protein NUTIK01_09470 [Novosphingobium sp. IK01]